MVTIQSSEPLPDGALDARHYRAIHRHLFGPVYRWAGKDRTIRIAKDASMFCYPEQIGRQMDILFADLARADHLRGLDAEAFAAGAAHVLSELNVIHPFREGNGRAQKAFLVLLAERAGHAIDVGRIDRQRYLEAMIAAFNGDEAPLTRVVRSLL
ncbi:Fic/DOC family protein [Brevundimonas sp.]|uniref:Fic/DOC family protein n=1 Tax=Brevundimonas sp. TaxID=1871086 RepID=UPI003D0BE7FB